LVLRPRIHKSGRVGSGNRAISFEHVADVPPVVLRGQKLICIRITARQLARTVPRLGLAPEKDWLQ
jgi:hypothetical protein